MNFKSTTIAGVIIASVLIAGCGPKKPLVTQQQISDARSQGTLIQLYNKVQSDIATASGSSKESLQSIAQQIAQKLAEDEQTRIYQTIEDARLPSGAAPLSLLGQLKQDAEKLKSWNTERYNQTRSKISTESTLAQDALSRQLIVVSKIPVSDQVQRLNALQAAAKIAGEGSAQYDTYMQQKAQTIDSWMVEADTAIANRKYTLAATFLRKVIGIDPENSEAKEKLGSSEKSGFETSFRKALEDSKPELAYSELLRISESPLFSSVKSSLDSSIDLLHDFFINRALQSSSQGALKGAYKNFLKARNIRSIMDKPYQTNAEFDYLKKLMNYAEVLKNQKRLGEQLAYLEIVSEFNPEYPKVKEAIAKARKNIVEFASTSMLINDFEQTGTHHSAGKSVAQQAYSWVFNNMPGDVALVSAQQMAQADQAAPGRLLRLEGHVLQAGVDSENTPGEKTMRVVTETIKTPNPAYKKWIDDGKEGSAPPEFNIQEKHEDIKVKVTYSKKTGVLSVNYKLIDQRTGQVLLNENARDRQVFESEGNEGISIGEYRLPFKRPELPSEIEIMEQLSSKVADSIGQKLNATLKQPDARYEALGDKALEQKQYAQAKAFYGYATAIRHARGGAVAEVRKKLIDSVVNH